jgi:hypothetical protein
VRQSSEEVEDGWRPYPPVQRGIRGGQRGSAGEEIRLGALGLGGGALGGGEGEVTSRTNEIAGPN